MIRTFWDLLQRYSITIPQIQRDYVQGRKTADKARKQLIDDIYIALTEENRPLDLNYIYGQVDANNNFIPVDGQQRLSMLLALYTYIFAKEENDDKLKTLKKFNYDTRETTKRFLENLIDHIGEFFKSSDDVVNEGDAISKFIDDAYWFSNEWNKDPSVVSFKKVLDEIHNKF